MLPFYVLLMSFLLSSGIIYLLGKKIDWVLAGRISLSIMLLFTAMGHFIFISGMSKMLPGFIPAKEVVIYLTGLMEIAAAIGIHIARFRKLTGILLIVFFIMILPANIKASLENLDYKTGINDGPGLSYLWFRIPFQCLLVGWAYCFVVRKR
ncbi:hypothetical protein KZP23_06255 [Echinicola marina]|uniref:DoxX family protein n=1 Tax=Echinicola marina TaxID=2859768 RepID=UPI001CF6F32C|nr:hypothetical protein [Echinicola marina]UCS94619.1 hypothetical protein KZP23_06255 [Echinicola marina]